jgi:hypothetical protein
MFKKMMLLVVAAAALAVPASAQAQAVLHEGATNIPVGTEVTATSTNLVTTSPLGELKCALVTIHGTVTKNDTTSAVIANKATTTEGCNVPITSPTAGTITIGASGTGVAAGATFVAGGACDYAGNIPFAYTAGTDVLSVTGEKQFSGPGACGQATMKGSFTLETTGGGAITIG